MVKYKTAAVEAQAHGGWAGCECRWVAPWAGRTNALPSLQRDSFQQSAPRLTGCSRNGPLARASSSMIAACLHTVHSHARTAEAQARDVLFQPTALWEWVANLGDESSEYGCRRQGTRLRLAGFGTAVQILPSSFPQPGAYRQDL